MSPSGWAKTGVSASMLSADAALAVGAVKRRGNGLAAPAAGVWTGAAWPTGRWLLPGFATSAATGGATTSLAVIWAGGPATTGTTGATAAAEACIEPVPLSSQGIDRSGMAARMRCTTSRLGLLRPDRMWLTIGRATPMASANWVGVSCRVSSRVRMRSTIVINLITNVALLGLGKIQLINPSLFTIGIHALHQHCYIYKLNRGIFFICRLDTIVITVFLVGSLVLFRLGKTWL